MNKAKPRLVILSTCLFCFSANVIGNDIRLNPVDFDQDKDGLLSSVESITYFSHQKGLPDTLVYDRDQNLAIDEHLLDGLPEPIRAILIESFHEKIKAGEQEYAAWLAQNNKPSGTALSFDQADAQLHGIDLQAIKYTGKRKGKYRR